MNKSTRMSASESKPANSRAQAMGEAEDSGDGGKGGGGTGAGGDGGPSGVGAGTAVVRGGCLPRTCSR